MVSAMNVCCIALFTMLYSYHVLSQTVLPTDCIDQFNQTIPERSRFLPTQDPCLICVCLKAKPVQCTKILCATPTPNEMCHSIIASKLSCCRFECSEISSYESDYGTEYDTEQTPNGLVDPEYRTYKL